MPSREDWIIHLTLPDESMWLYVYSFNCATNLLTYPKPNFLQSSHSSVWSPMILCVSRLATTFNITVFCTVDILNVVGLRDGNTQEDGATVVPGPTGLMDAFALTRELSAPINGREWELIGMDFDTQFGVYTSFDALNYVGSIISIRNGVLSEFSLSFNSSGDTATNETRTQTLSITLPRFSFDFDVEIPSQGNDAFQSIGIALEEGRLIVTVNCTVVDIIPVEFAVGELPSDRASVTIFSDPTIVSSY